MRSVLDLGRGTPRKQHCFGCFHEFVFVRDVLEHCPCLERDSGAQSLSTGFPKQTNELEQGQHCASPNHLPVASGKGTARKRFHSACGAEELEVRKGRL